MFVSQLKFESMSTGKREGNRPDRRVAPEGFLDETAKKALLDRIRYVGSGHHKLRPGDYGFVPSHNPRPSKSPCDELREVSFEEASKLFLDGIRHGMVSQFPTGGVPKYVWAVDEAGEVYEAKCRPDRETEYHGYRLTDNDQYTRKYILNEWRRRCR